MNMTLCVSGSAYLAGDRAITSGECDQIPTAGRSGYESSAPTGSAGVERHLWRSGIFP